MWTIFHYFAANHGIWPFNRTPFYPYYTGKINFNNVFYVTQYI